MFRLTEEEKNELVTICHRFSTMKHSASLPFVLTEHGVTMLASILNSEQAVKMSILIVRAFIKLRKILSSHKEITFKLTGLEARINKHDADILTIIQALKQLLKPPKQDERRIKGFGR